MLKNIVLVFGMLFTSISSQAALITHFGYEREASSNIIKGGGLEWLKWDVTKGMSIKHALATYSAQGWRLASNSDMTLLFNAFEFGKTDWDTNGQIKQAVWQPWNFGEVSRHNDFLELFGSTHLTQCATEQFGCYDTADPFRSALAMFDSGLMVDGSALYDYALVYDDSRFFNGRGAGLEFGMWAEITRGNLTDEEGPARGVALVRSDVVKTNPIPLPSSISLLVLCLVALGSRRKKLCATF